MPAPPLGGGLWNTCDPKAGAFELSDRYKEKRFNVFEELHPEFNAVAVQNQMQLDV